MSYTILEKDINDLINQINVSKEEASNLLIKHNGNIVESILNFYENQDNKDYSDVENKKKNLDEEIKKYNICEENGINSNRSEDNIKVLREILNEKDIIAEGMKKKEIDISDVKFYEYITFSYDTEKFYKKNINTNKDLLLNNTIKNFLIEEYEKNDKIKSDELKLVCRTLKDKGLTSLKKWNLENPTIFYFEHQIRFDSHPRENKIATRLLRNSNYFKKYEIIVGPVIILNNWD